MKNFLLNTFFLFGIITAAGVITLFAFTNKTNSYSNGLKTTVIKTEVPIRTESGGVVDKLYVTEGKQVKKGDQLVILHNKTLEDRIELLEEQFGNPSAEIELNQAQTQLENLRIESPIDGVVGDITISQNIPVTSETPLMKIYSNNTKLLAEMSLSDLETVKNAKKISVYSPRLDQEFPVTPLNVKAEQIESEDGIKKIGLFLALVYESDAAQLLQNEDLQLKVTTRESEIPAELLSKIESSVESIASNLVEKYYAYNK